MSYNNQLVISITGAVGPLLLRAWMGSLRLQTFFEPPFSDPFVPNRKDVPNALYITWHDRLLLLAWMFGRFGPYVMISQSRDGELVSRVAAGLGWRVIRGSSTRQGATAVRAAIARAEREQDFFHMAFTVDGPRGPRHFLKEGVVFLASRTGLPIVPVGVAFHHFRQAGSWDRMLLPRPFTKAFVYFGKPLVVPAEINREEIEQLRSSAEIALNQANDQAYQLLAAGDIKPV